MSNLLLIYLVRDIRSDPPHSYWPELTRAILRQAQLLGFRTRVMLDRRPPNRLRAVHADVTALIADGELAGIIAPTIDLRIDQGLFGCGVPLAVHGPVTLAGAVDHDQRQLGELAVDMLIAAGCQSLAAISPQVIPGLLIDGDREDTALAYGFVKRSEETGIPLIGSGIRGRDLHYPFEKTDQEQLGIRLIEELAHEGHHQLGVLVWPDSMAAGAVQAWRAQGGRESGMTLLAHRNRGLGTQMWAGVMMVESDHEEIAAELLAEIIRQKNGAPPGRTLIAYRQVQA